MARTVFKATVREPVEVQIGDEEVDLSRLSMRTVSRVIGLLGDDPTKVAGADFEKIVEAVAVLCEPSNPNVTTEYLMGLDAFEEVIPFMEFAMSLIGERGKSVAGLADLKNPIPSSTSPRE